MPNIERRDFLKMIGAGSAGVGAGFVLAEANKHPIEFLLPYPIPPEDFSPGIATWYNSVCTLCAAGCGISVRTREGRAKKIEGNPAHPVNQGRLCALGQAGLQVLYNPDRVTAPSIRSGERGAGSFSHTTWDQGLGSLVKELGQSRGDRVAYLGAGSGGQIDALIEKFMARLGSGQIHYYDYEHPHALHAATERLFGEQRLPYYDIANASFVLSFGADFLGNWLSPVHYGLGYGRGRQGQRDSRSRFVQVEPRMSLSGAAADQWIPARPGTEGMLALGIAHIIVANGYTGADRDDWSRALQRYTPTYVSESTSVSAETIVRIADEFSHADAALAIGGDATGNHTNGVDALVAVNALNILAGNIGKTGGIVFNPDSSLGGPSVKHRAGYRQMLELAADANSGKLDILIVNGCNPAFTLPESAGFVDALANIPLIVSLGSFVDETSAHADLILPSHTYLESWGDHVPHPGVGFPVAAVSQPVTAPLYNTRATGDIVLEISRRLGFDKALPWPDTETYLKDGWRRLYEQQEVAEDAPDFDMFWRSLLQAGVWGENRRSAQQSFSTSGITFTAFNVDAPGFAGEESEYPFVLMPYISNSLRDGRGANLPWLQELPDSLTSVVYGSWIEINPQTAAKLGIREGDVVSVESPTGKLAAPALIYPGIRPDVVAMPIGQGHTSYGRYAQNRGANPLKILASLQEPVTGGLASNATRIKLVKSTQRIKLVKTGGESRELGREIVQTTGSSKDGAQGDHSANLHNIPITVESS